jgi:hypothetical protein
LGSSLSETETEGKPVHELHNSITRKITSLLHRLKNKLCG